MQFVDRFVELDALRTAFRSGPSVLARVSGRRRAAVFGERYRTPGRHNG